MIESGGHEIETFCKIDHEIEIFFFKIDQEIKRP
jgi:hypothetical protein